MARARFSSEGLPPEVVEAAWKMEEEMPRRVRQLSSTPQEELVSLRRGSCGTQRTLQARRRASDWSQEALEDANGSRRASETAPVTLAELHMSRRRSSANPQSSLDIIASWKERRPSQDDPPLATKTGAASECGSMDVEPPMQRLSTASPLFKDIPALPLAITGHRNRAVSAATRNMNVLMDCAGNISARSQSASAKVDRLSSDQIKAQIRLIGKYEWAVDTASHYNALLSGELQPDFGIQRIQPGVPSSPEVKDWQYFKRNWTEGQPGKATAVWEDTSRIPLRYAIHHPPA
ncbi:MAG: hypothetical protein SGPRY_005762 [Prymnesium sp.]